MMYTNIPKKEKAVKMRKEGHTYSEILKQVFVAKSTLSEWFREVRLSKPQQQKLTKKKLEAGLRGGEARRKQRILLVEKINKETLNDIKHISKRELWLIGIVLYWAEGGKEKDSRHGSGINFNNSDPRMIKLFVQWLLESCGVDEEKIGCEIYIHENSKNSVDQAKKYWSEASGLGLEKFNTVYFKKNKIKTNRKNVGSLYFGLLRVKVKASSSLLRKVAGWTEAIVQRAK